MKINNIKSKLHGAMSTAKSATLIMFAAAALLTSCDQENEGAIYEPTFQNVSFVTSGQSLQTSESTLTVPVELSRAITNGTYTANLVFDDGGSGATLSSNSVTFGNGEGMATAYVNFSNLTPGDTYTVTLQLDDATAATADTITKSQVATKTTVTVSCQYTWTAVATGTYTYAQFFEGDDSGLTLYQADQNSKVYKITNWGYGVDFQFSFNDDGTITVADQPIGYVHSSYGAVYVCDLVDYVGGTSYGYSFFDSANNIYYFAVVYYVSAGVFGYGYETFTITSSAAKANAPQAPQAIARAQALDPTELGLKTLNFDKVELKK